MADDQASKDVQILAEAERIRNDSDRSEAARKLARDKKRKRDVDVVAGKGSLAGKLKARRDAVESGDLEGASVAFANETETEDE